MRPDDQQRERLSGADLRRGDPQRPHDEFVGVLDAGQLMKDPGADDMLGKQQRDEQAEHRLRGFPGRHREGPPEIERAQHQRHMHQHGAVEDERCRQSSARPPGTTAGPPRRRPATPALSAWLARCIVTKQTITRPEYSRAERSMVSNAGRRPASAASAPCAGAAVPSRQIGRLRSRQQWLCAPGSALLDRGGCRPPASHACRPAGSLPSRKPMSRLDGRAASARRAARAAAVRFRPERQGSQPGAPAATMPCDCFRSALRMGKPSS